MTYYIAYLTKRLAYIVILIAYLLIQLQIVGYKYPPAIIVKQSSKLQVVSGIEIDHFKNVHYVSII